MLQIMRAAMRVETNISLPVLTSGEDGEQSVMGESHAVNSDFFKLHYRAKIHICLI